MVRLVFRPYTQVRRTICTSVSLRASTRVSSGFAPLRHSSPSFGSRHACSHSNPSQKIKVGQRCNPLEDPTKLASLCLTGLPTRRLAHMSDSLVRVSRRVEWGAHESKPGEHRCRGTSKLTWASHHNQGNDMTTSMPTTRDLIAAMIRLDPCNKPTNRPFF